MDEQQKVLWSEGAFLVPQHFQQADRYHEGQLRRRARSLNAFDWGLTELKIDLDALQGGDFVLKRCGAVLPDGLQLVIPDLDEAPASRPVGPAFDVKREALGVFLACAEEKPGRPVFHSTGGGEGLPLRYRPGQVALADADARGRERDIVIGRRNARLLFEGEATESLTTLKIAEVVRTETGQFALSPRYIPPLLYLAASDTLLGLLRRLIEIVSKKSEDLSAWRRQRAPGLIEFTTSEASRFWFLYTVNSALPPLLHALYQPRLHPEHLYVELGRLFGCLATFADEGAAKDVPRYDHNDLTTTFSYLEEWIRYFVSTSIPDRVVPVPLEKTRDVLHVGRITDDRLTDSAQFVLAAMSGIPEDRLARELPLKAKLSSQDRIEALVKQAVRGVTLKWLNPPPPEVPVHPGRVYFSLDKSGEHWEAVRASRSIAIHVPPEFVDLKLELMAIKEV